MYLADPRHEIPVRRVLSQAECKLWYPGNEEALAYNRDLEEAVAEAPSGRSGVISEGDYRRRQVRQRGGGSTPMMAANYLAAGAAGIGRLFSRRSQRRGFSGGSITRGTKYTQPKQLTLNTKYDGVPKIEVYPGYAVLIVGAEGSRRVVIGRTDRPSRIRREARLHGAEHRQAQDDRPALPDGLPVREEQSGQRHRRFRIRRITSRVR
jgi:major vault protein